MPANPTLHNQNCWERGSGGVQSTGVSQSVRETSRDESQNALSPEKLFKIRDLELPKFWGVFPSCWPHSAGYTRTFLHQYFPVPKIENPNTILGLGIVTEKDPSNKEDFQDHARDALGPEPQAWAAFDKQALSVDTVSNNARCLFSLLMFGGFEAWNSIQTPLQSSVSPQTTAHVLRNPTKSMRDASQSICRRTESSARKTPDP